MISIVQSIFGLIAGFVAFLSFYVYIRSINKKSCKPNLFSWSIQAINGLIICFTYYLSGAWTTLWIAVGYAVGPILITILSFKYGEKKWSWIEKFSAIGVFCTFLLWAVSGSAFIGLLSAIAVDFFSLVPTIEKSYKRPKTEDRGAWLLATIANILNLFAINSLSIKVILYPVYLVVIDGVITFFLIHGGINHSTRSVTSTPNLEKYPGSKSK